MVAQIRITHDQAAPKVDLPRPIECMVAVPQPLPHSSAKDLLGPLFRHCHSSRNCTDVRKTSRGLQFVYIPLETVEISSPSPRTSSASHDDKSFFQYTLRANLSRHRKCYCLEAYWLRHTRPENVVSISAAWLRPKSPILPLEATKTEIRPGS